MLRTSLLLGLLFLPGCCFIGCDEELLFVPDSTVTVTDTEGNPLAEATVVLARYEEHPHFRPLDDWTVLAGPDGKASFTHKTGTVTQYPMMMHGVGSFAWQFCASAPGHQTGVIAWDESHGGEPVEVTLKLEKGESDPCAEVVQFEPFDASPMLACAVDADCVYRDLDIDCCESCYPQIANATSRAERARDCEGKTAKGCNVCEPRAEDRPPRCLAGICRGPKAD